MRILISLFIFSFALFILEGRPVWAAAETTDPTPPTVTDTLPATTRASDSLRLSLDVPLVLQSASVAPLGFDTGQIEAPYNLVFAWHREPVKHPLFTIEANATFPHSSVLPALGVTPGMAFRIKSVIIEVALDIQDQQTAAKAPYKGSQFDTWISSLMAGVRYAATPQLTVGLDSQYSSFLKTEIADYEGLETDIDHQGTLIFSPWAEIELPAQIRLRGQLDFDMLGATAIASKDFALGISGQTIERLGVSLNRRFGDFGAEIHYYWVTGFRDATELAYQAPFYYRNYLLSPQTLTLGVSWYF